MVSTFSVILWKEWIKYLRIIFLLLIRNSFKHQLTRHMLNWLLMSLFSRSTFMNYLVIPHTVDDITQLLGIKENCQKSFLQSSFRFLPIMEKFQKSCATVKFFEKWSKIKDTIFLERKKTRSYKTDLIFKELGLGNWWLGKGGSGNSNIFLPQANHNVRKLRS